MTRPTSATMLAPMAAKSSQQPYRTIVTERSTQTSVTFRRPFTLGDDATEYPAGTYTLETTQEVIECLSMLALRRVSTMLEVVTYRDGFATRQLIDVAPSELAAAQHRDAQAGAGQAALLGAAANGGHETASIASAQDNAAIPQPIGRN
jgi:hypothetical protein